MPVLVPETAVVGRILVAAEFGPHGVIDQLGQITRDSISERRPKNT